MKMIAMIIAFLVFSSTGAAWAKLTVIGTATYEGSEHQLIYCDSLELVFLDYRKPAAPLAKQREWVAGLDSALTLNLYPSYAVTWRDAAWRLPASAGGVYKWGWDGITNNAGYNMTSSEMAYLYYVELGNPGYLDTSRNVVSNYGLINPGPFTSLAENWYWSGTPYTADPTVTDKGWIFTFYSGHQVLTYLTRSQYGLAVRAGTVRPAAGFLPPIFQLLFSD